MPDENYRDYNYYKNHGWFESDFYYPVKISYLKKLSGKIFDKLSVRIFKNRERNTRLVFYCKIRKTAVVQAVCIISLQQT